MKTRKIEMLIFNLPFMRCFAFFNLYEFLKFRLINFLQEHFLFFNSRTLLFINPTVTQVIRITGKQTALFFSIQ